MNDLFRSFFLGGFECATHQRWDRRRIDVVAATGHDFHAAGDYRLLRSAGIRTVRDGLRWHLIESTPGTYDWSSFLPMLEASIATGTQVVWDLCHWGVPEGLDPFSEEFVTRFARFAGAAARLIRSRTHEVPWFCPMNEISFWAWVGGDVAAFFPHQERRGNELKRNLVRAAIAAMRAVRQVDPRARFVQAEPLINISGKTPEAAAEAAVHTAGQYEACDLISGRDPALGGTADLLDVIGVNYYWNNQWVHFGERTPPGHLLHKPLHKMLVELWERYRRPILISETGAEEGAEIGWLNYILGELRQAECLGVQLVGVCLYPVMDYPGWDDERHCPCGLIRIDGNWDQRTLRTPLADELHLQQTIREGLDRGMARHELELAGAA